MKVAARFDMSQAFVQKLLKQKQMTGHVQQKKTFLLALKVYYIRAQLN